METLYLYLLKPKAGKGKHLSYDIYDSLIVCAFSEEDAATIHPFPHPATSYWENGMWVYSPDEVDAKLIGTAINQKRGVVLASFNAG